MTMPVEEALRAFIAGVGTQEAAAASLGVSPEFLSMVLHGHRGVSRKIAAMLGYQRVVTYIPTVAEEKTFE
jgi:DNA-binding transcriptional regulator YdaS (Cro superfamily)